MALQTHRNKQRGGSKLSLLVTLAVIGSLIFAAVKIAPPYMDKFQLQDALNTEARYAMANRKSEEDVRADVLKKIKEIGIPATDKGVVVTSGGMAVSIAVHYTVPIDLAVYKFDLDFNVTADSHII